MQQTGLVVGGSLDGQVLKMSHAGRIQTGKDVYTFRQIRNRINDGESINLCLWVPEDVETYQALFTLATNYAKTR